MRLRWKLCVVLMGLATISMPTAGRSSRRHRKATLHSTPFPSPNEQGLFARVQNLAEQVSELSAKSTRDRSRLKRAERRSKSNRSHVDILHAHVVQLRQHVTEINSRLTSLDDLAAALQLDLTKVNSGQQLLKDEAVKVKHFQHRAEERLDVLEKNCTTLEFQGDFAHGRLGLMEKSLSEIQDIQHNFVGKLEKMDNMIQQLGNQVDSSLYYHDAQNDSPQKAAIILQNLSNSDQRNTQKKKADAHLGHAQSDEVEIGISRGGDLGSEEGSGDLGSEEGSGDINEFFIVEEKYDTIGSGDVELRVNGDEDLINGTDNGNWSNATPTPLTTATVPTLTQSSVPDPTSPTLSCSCTGVITQLRQRVEELELRLNSSVMGEDVLEQMANETSRLDAAVTKRDETLEHVQGNLSDLGTTVSRLAGQMTSLRLGEFLESLQNSLLNFTNNVFTLDQWEMVNQQLMNVTYRTQATLTELGSRLMDNEALTSELQMKVQEYQTLSERQYRLLQTHVIRLNNSLQDMKEEVGQLSDLQPGRPRRLSGKVAGSSSVDAQSQEVLTSRVDDLALQLVYSENRLAHLETQALNSSLLACQKSTNDLHQDASLQRMDQQWAETQRDIVVLKETVKRLDLGLYKVHGNTKASNEVVRKVQGQVKDIEKVKHSVGLLQKEVDNLLFQLPVDCSDYFERGYRQSTEYVIYPRNAAHSVKVQCLMNDRDAADVTTTKEVNSDDTEEGGWTVIHQRNSGKVNFTRSWEDYAGGFGSTSSEYWLGNDNIYLLSLHRNYSLAIHMRDIFGGYWRATYRRFAMGSKEENYRLTLSGFQGNATDTMSYSAGMTFSTYDRDTDLSSSPCARYNGGGWWYSHCQISNLNGPYNIGMIWFQREWHDWLQLRQVVMMVKPGP